MSFVRKFSEWRQRTYSKTANDKNESQTLTLEHQRNHPFKHPFYLLTQIPSYKYELNWPRPISIFDANHPHAYGKQIRIHRMASHGTKRHSTVQHPLWVGFPRKFNKYLFNNFGVIQHISITVHASQHILTDFVLCICWYCWSGVVMGNHHSTMHVQFSIVDIPRKQFTVSGCISFRFICQTENRFVHKQKK